MPPEIKHYWLYALRLEKGKYYIGITSLKDPNTRIKQHVNGFIGAKWTEKYKPVASAHKPIDLGYITLEQAQGFEYERTRRFMDKYGYNNVRGADLAYCGMYLKLGSLFIPWSYVIQLFGYILILVAILSLYFKAYRS